MKNHKLKIAVQKEDPKAAPAFVFLPCTAILLPYKNALLKCLKRIMFHVQHFARQRLSDQHIRQLKIFRIQRLLIGYGIMKINCHNLALVKAKHNVSLA